MAHSRYMLSDGGSVSRRPPMSARPVRPLRQPRPLRAPDLSGVHARSEAAHTQGRTLLATGKAAVGAARAKAQALRSKLR